MTQAQALAILKTGVNVFLTGEPGSGKTHVINEYAEYLRERGIEPAVTASTGIAATHLGGLTIHSWSGIGIKAKLDKADLFRISSNDRIARRVKRAKVLIIDEISMLLPDTLNAVELVCRKIKQDDRPFGGLQIIFVGDFFQLPPIADSHADNEQQLAIVESSARFASSIARRARFAYDSSSWRKAEPVICYLSEQYRQDDPNFLAVLAAIRGNNFGENHLRHIQTRKIGPSQAPEHAPKLYSHNIDVDRVNNAKLDKLPGKAQVFEMSFYGPKALVMGLVKGCLSPEYLTLKIGAEVMFTKNNSKEGYVNGTLGSVKKFAELSGRPLVELKNGREIEVGPMDWTIEENSRIRAKITQLPLRLAWAITVHKSQGLSLDEAVMDLSRVFEYGQGYVALSRVRRLNGLHLLDWNERAFMVSPEIIAKDQDFRQTSAKALESFLKIAVGAMQKKWDDFIIFCGGAILSASEDNKAKTSRQNSGDLDTCKQTLALWRDGHNIALIAKARGLKETTIIHHIEMLALKGLIDQNELSRLLTPALASGLEKICLAFKELGPERLAPVFEKFNGQYSYDELRIARIVCFKNDIFLR